MSPAVVPTRQVVAERARKLRFWSAVTMVAGLFVHAALLPGHGLDTAFEVVLVVLVTLFSGAHLLRQGVMVVDDWCDRDRRGLPAYGKWSKLACSVAAHAILSVWVLSIAVSVTSTAWPGRRSGDPKGPVLIALRDTGAAVFFGALLVAFLFLGPWLVAEAVAGFKEPRGRGGSTFARAGITPPTG